LAVGKREKKKFIRLKVTKYRVATGNKKPQTGNFLI